jgi:hypothetical protein
VTVGELAAQLARWPQDTRIVVTIGPPGGDVADITGLDEFAAYNEAFVTIEHGPTIVQE